jgi:DNA-binding NarL/FixJ family response regulator
MILMTRYAGIIMATAAKILLVDDVAAIRRSIRFWIETETDWKICGEAENGKAAVEMVQKLRPDVVLLDLSMPVMNGLEAARQIAAIAPEIHILMFTLHSYPELVREACKLGVKDVISKSEGVGSNVLHAIRSVLAA